MIELQSRETIREGIALGLGISVFYSTECPPDSRIIYRPVDTAERDYQLRSYLVCQSQRRRDALMRVLQSIVNEIRDAGPASSRTHQETHRRIISVTEINKDLDARVKSAPSPVHA